MFNEQTAHPNPYLQALKDHLPVAARVFVVILLLCGAWALLTRQYSASAALALNPKAVPNSNQSGQQQSAVEVAWSALTDEQIAGIISRFQLGSAIMTRLRSEGQVFTYVRSNISLNVAETPGIPSSEVIVSYTSESPSNAIGVANAIAQDMSQAKAAGPQSPPPAAAQQSPPGAAAPAPVSAPTSNDALEKSRAQLKLLSQSQGQDTTALQAQVQQHLKRDADLQAARRDIGGNLAMVEQEISQQNAAPQAAPPPPAPNPARVALEQQIKTAQGHLATLRERYTELYPDVQAAESALAALEAQLRSIPPEKPQVIAPRPARRSAALNALSQQENQLRSLESNLDDEIESNQQAAEALRQSIAAANGVAQQYFAAQQRYKALLQVQEALDEGGSSGGNGPSAGPTPLFVMVKSATSADALGVAFKPLFWILSLLFALLAAAAAVYLAEQFAPAVHERAPSRSFHPS